eukprot:365067-Chlamydomonas_euryale.AAC.22
MVRMIRCKQEEKLPQHVQLPSLQQWTSGRLARQHAVQPAKGEHCQPRLLQTAFPEDWGMDSGGLPQNADPTEPYNAKPALRFMMQEAAIGGRATWHPQRWQQQQAPPSPPPNHILGRTRGLNFPKGQTNIASTSSCTTRRLTSRRPRFSACIACG